MTPRLFTALSGPLSAVIKGSQPLSRVIIRGGVPARERLHGTVTEPVVYMIRQHIVGGFCRTNAGKSMDEHLDAPEAVFSPMLLVGRSSQSRLLSLCTTNEEPNHFYLYGVVGQLAALTANDELSAAQAEAPSALEFV